MMALNWQLYQDSYSTVEMRQIWSEDATISAWIDVEKSLARCQAEVGLIPKEAATEIERLSTLDLDYKAMLEEMNLVGRPIIGLVAQMRHNVGATFSKYVHYLTTTQDIMDTATAMQMKHGVENILVALDRVVEHIDCHIELHQETIMIGRTNGQYALPIKFSAKLKVWRNELSRRKVALTSASERGLMIQLGGPVGDLSEYEAGAGQAVKSKLAKTMGLGVPDGHWQNARDGVADIVTALGVLCASLCKISHNINLLSSSDIGELSEGYEIGKGASSSMIHKKNQRASEFGEAVARLGRQRSEQIGEVTLHEHERSGGVWIAEWIIVPETFLLTSGALMWSERLFASLKVCEDIMAKNSASAKF